MFPGFGFGCGMKGARRAMLRSRFGGLDASSRRSGGARVMVGLDSAVSAAAAANAHTIESEKARSIRQERKHE